MPFFKFRRNDASSHSLAGSAAQVESVEVLRKRARHRLIGASVLVLLGVVGFPLIFDTQPRPVPVNIPIEIPSQNSVKPLVAPPIAKIKPAASVLPKEQEALARTLPGQDAQAQPDLKKEVRPAAAVEIKGRIVVQIGAFSDTAKADEARMKLEKAGLKTYTQIAETKEGKRIRVRVGPFASKAEAEKVIGKIKSLDLSAAILTL